MTYPASRTGRESVALLSFQSIPRICCRLAERTAFSAPMLSPVGAGDSKVSHLTGLLLLRLNELPVKFIAQCLACSTCCVVCVMYSHSKASCLRCTEGLLI